MSGRDQSPNESQDGVQDRTARPEHRWPVVVGVLLALGLYVLLPSEIVAAQRYMVAGIGVLLLVPLIAINPHHYLRETRASRLIEVALALVIVLANQVALVMLIVTLVNGANNHGGSLLLASLQVWVTNVIGFALLFWCIDRGGPVARTQAARSELQGADFRFPQDEDHDAVVEVARGSSDRSDWVPTFIDYVYFSLTNSMAFSATDTMPLTVRAKALMGLESFAGFVMLALVIAHAVAQLG